MVFLWFFPMFPPPSARFYIADDVGHYDVVPAVASWVGFVHPFIETLRLSTAPQFGEEI